MHTIGGRGFALQKLRCASDGMNHHLQQQRRPCHHRQQHQQPPHSQQQCVATNITTSNNRDYTSTNTTKPITNQHSAPSWARAAITYIGVACVRINPLALVSCHQLRMYIGVGCTLSWFTQPYTPLGGLARAARCVLCLGAMRTADANYRLKCSNDTRFNAHGSTPTICVPQISMGQCHIWFNLAQCWTTEPLQCGVRRSCRNRWRLHTMLHV